MRCFKHRDRWNITSYRSFSLLWPILLIYPTSQLYTAIHLPNHHSVSATYIGNTRKTFLHSQVLKFSKYLCCKNLSFLSLTELIKAWYQCKYLPHLKPTQCSINFNVSWLLIEFAVYDYRGPFNFSFIQKRGIRTFPNKKMYIWNFLTSWAYIYDHENMERKKMQSSPEISN